MATNLTKEQIQKLKDKMLFRESTGDYTKVSKKHGYVGGYQFGAQALETIGYLKPGSYAKAKAKYKNGNRAVEDPKNWTGKDKIKSLNDFVKNPQVQDKAFEENLNQNFKSLKQKGLIKADTPASQVAGYLAASHLIGTGTIAKKGLSAKDANQITGHEYFKLGQQAVAPSKTKSTLAKAVESLIPSANAAEAPVEDDAETSLKLGASGEGLKFGASGEGLQYPQSKRQLTFEDFQDHMKRKVFEPEIPGDTVSPEWQGFMPDATVPTPPPSAGAGRGFVNPPFVASNQDEIRRDTVDPEWVGYMDALRAERGNLFGGYPAIITEPIQVIPNVRREYIPEVSIGAGAGRGFENPPSVMPDEVYRDNEIRPKSFMGEPVAPQNIWRDSEGNPILDRFGGYIYQKQY